MGVCWRGRPGGTDFEPDRWLSPALGEGAEAALKVAVQELPEAAGIGMANWNWRVLRFVSGRWHQPPQHSLLNYLHRIGIAFKRPVPKKRLLALLRNGSPSWRRTPPDGGGVSKQPPRRYSSLTRPTFGPIVAGQVGAAFPSLLMDSSSPATARRPATLGGVPGDRRGGVDLATPCNSNSGRLLQPLASIAGEAHRAAEP